MSNGKCNKPWPLSLRMKGGSRVGQKWGREAAQKEKEAVKVTLKPHKESKTKQLKYGPEIMAFG